MATPQQRRVSEHVRQWTREWFRKAEHELAFLEIAPLDLNDPPTDTTYKMAHMVAEYSLKAYLMLNKRKIDKSHSTLGDRFLSLRIHRINCRHAARRAIGQYVATIVKFITGVAFRPMPRDTASQLMALDSR